MCPFLARPRKGRKEGRPLLFFTGFSCNRSARKETRFAQTPFLFFPHSLEKPLKSRRGELKKIRKNPKGANQKLITANKSI